MVAPPKRRRVSFYLSLPLVVVVVLLLVAKLAALQRADVIVELTERVAHCEAAEAAAAVRQLASMPRPPMAILVSAATSGDRVVADEARRSIGKLLRQAQRRVEAGEQTAVVAGQLADLAESLAAKQSLFSAVDHRWLGRTTDKVLRLANQIPPRHAPLVAVHCDSILTAIALSKSPTTEAADSEPEDELAVTSEDAMTEGSRDARQARLEREVADGLPPPLKTASAREDSLSGEHAVADEAESVPERVMQSPWRASWSHPIFRIVPAAPIESMPGDGRESNPSPPADAAEEPVETPTNERPLADMDSRDLLQRWLAAEGGEIFPLEDELTRRGFGRLSERLVQRFFSEVAEDRLRLVDDVLTAPGVDARPWLMLLARDADADVRLLAVSIMATSNDPLLVERAWQAALHDRDPRIARLAARLRERREGRLRRF